MTDFINWSDFITSLRKFNVRFFVSAAGGGAHFVNQCVSTVGASDFFIGSVQPYDVNYTKTIIPWRHNEQLCSQGASAALAQHAYVRATSVSLESSHMYEMPLGIGVTAAYRSRKPLKGGERVWVSVRNHDRLLSYSLEFNQGDRAIQDYLTSQLCMALVSAIGFSPHNYISALLDFCRPKATVRSGRCSLDEASLHDLPCFIDEQGEVHSIKSMPSDMVVFPGSFNPFHIGHLKMLKTVQEYSGKSVALELSIENVEKEKSVEHLHQLVARINMLRGYPIIVSKYPRFYDKVRKYNSDMILGEDTFLRLIDPSYLPSDLTINELAEYFQKTATRFYVFSRGEGGGKKWYDTLENQWSELVYPFFVDYAVSSTKIRKLYAHQERETR